MPLQICPHCGYEWMSIVKQPKMCPLCKIPIVKTRKAVEKSYRRMELKSLEPDLTGIYFDCTRCKRKNAARFKFRKDFLCPHCMVDMIKEMVPEEF